MVSPIASSRQNSSHVAQRGTRSELASSTRGAISCGRATPTGFPDCTSSVSSSRRSRSVATMASKAFHDRAAFPVPPYTTRSSGFSATSGSRLFSSIRSAASCCQPLHEISVPRGARNGPRLVAGSFTIGVPTLISSVPLPPSYPTPPRLKNAPPVAQPFLAVLLGCSPPVAQALLPVLLGCSHPVAQALLPVLLGSSFLLCAGCPIRRFCVWVLGLGLCSWVP